MLQDSVQAASSLDEPPRAGYILPELLQESIGFDQRVH